MTVVRARACLRNNYEDGRALDVWPRAFARVPACVAGPHPARSAAVVAIDPSPHASLLHWLDLIRVRPGMYLGAAPPHFGAMLDRLDTWIVGYGQAVRAHQMQDPGLDLYESFWQFLERKIGRSLTEGTIPTIRLISGSDAEAWETYWSLLGEFRARAG
jgi:hypothetical protein